MFLIIAIILLVFWILGLVWHIAGGLIHIALVLAIISAAAGFFTKKKV